MLVLNMKCYDVACLAYAIRPISLMTCNVKFSKVEVFMHIDLRHV